VSVRALFGMAAVMASGAVPCGAQPKPTPANPCHLHHVESDTTHLMSLTSEAEYARLLAASMDPRITSVKFTIDRQDPSASPTSWVVYYQNTTALEYHVEFASRFVPGLKGKRSTEINSIVELGAGARYIFGVLIYRPCWSAASAATSGPPGVAAFDISLPARPSAEVVAHTHAAVVRTSPLLASRLVFLCRVLERCGTHGDVSRIGVKWVSQPDLFR